MPIRSAAVSFLAHAAPLAALVVAGVLAPAARGDEFLDRVNRSFATIQPDKRSDTILLPVIGKLEAPPAAASDAQRAMLLPAGSRDWKAAADWAAAQPQKDAIEAVKKVTGVEDWKKAFAFGQPYGFDGVDPDLITAKLYTDLGDPPTLAAADHLYLPALRRLEILLHVEATRLAAEGDVNGALDLMIRTVQLGRQMADREFYAEKRWAMETIFRGLNRARDIAYVDFRSESPKGTAEAVVAALKFLDERGSLRIDEIRLPLGNEEAAKQLLTRIMRRGGGPDPDTFSTVLSDIAAKRRPLRRFSETAKWEAIRRLHGDEAASRRVLEQVYGDWRLRWSLDAFNPVQKLPTDFSKLNKAQFAAMEVIIGDIWDLHGLRVSLRAEAAGTRNALAVYGFSRRNNRLPPDLSAVEPTFVRRVSLDPFNATRGSFAVYAAPRGNQPLTIQVFPEFLGVKYTEFSFVVREGNFLMYVGGPDFNQDGGTRMTQMVEERGGDYLVWPPLVSLVRQNLVDTGRLR